ncbi:hypothetical protein ACIGO8_17450 [Streptomyces sp. NPDC053493]|uniref:hypothetical protein n=1 Tax=Streptomyces sp. NPDC053493 TaxID=3365705 RepID=UPI0037D58558
MGTENDRLVFDYLSRVGDLAQQRQVPAAERRELVSGLRDEIERRRAVKGEAVPGILGDLGSPDDVVARVAPEHPSSRGRGLSPDVSSDPYPKSSPAPSSDPAPPKGPAVPEPRTADWWQDDAGAAEAGEVRVPGFVGGVEIPELLKPPPADEDEDEDEGKGEREGEEEESRAPGPGTEPEGARGQAGRAPRRLRLGSPLLLVSALLLLVGAALGSVLPLAAGWLLAYFSRERRAAAVAIPGLAFTAGVVWLWGRVEGRWGAPVATGDAGMGAALADTWPWTLRAAAVASALFLLWRSRRV